MADVVNTIQTKILGEEEVRRLTGLIEAQEQAFVKLARSMQAQGATEAQVRAATANIAGNIAGLTKDLDAARAKMGGTFDARGIREFGRIAQDAQYGFSGITNNLVEIAPALGVLAVGIDVVSKNADAIARNIGRWKDGLDESQQGLKDNLDILQAFVGGMTLEGPKVRDAFGWIFELFPAISGLPTLGKALRVDPEAAKAEAEKKAGDKAIGGVLGAEDQERQKALKEAMEFLGGGDKFRSMLGAGLGKGDEADMRAAVAEALKTGDPAVFEKVRGRLRQVMKVGPGESDILQAFLPDRAGDQDDAAFDRANERYRESKKKRQELADAEYENVFEQLDNSNRRAIDRRKEREADAKVRREGEVDNARGRVHWLRDLVREERRQMRDPQTYGDFAGFLQGVQGSGGAWDRLDRTNTYLEKQLKVAEMQLEALRNLPAGP